MSILMGEFSEAEWQDEKQKSIKKIKRTEDGKRRKLTGMRAQERARSRAGIKEGRLVE